MLVTLFGIVMDVSPEQYWKAWFPMVVTLFGIVTDVSPEQLAKAWFPMLVTLFGIEQVVSFPRYLTRALSFIQKPDSVLTSQTVNPEGVILL